MKERPILFSTPMVQALLAGRKTQTRRICKGQRELSREQDFQIDTCPYGQPGDRLWVRESWYQRGRWKKIIPPEGVFEGDTEWDGDFAADYPTHGEIKEGWRKRPSIHMPRWASRITLEITAVRVERLQSISTDDAIAEGIDHKSMNDPRIEYRWLWESINGPGSWDKNPWVWVVEFKRVMTA